jgi:hypothetical protein
VSNIHIMTTPDFITSADLAGVTKNSGRNTRCQPAMLRKSQSMNAQMPTAMFALLTLVDFDSPVRGFSQATTGRPIW